MLEPDTRRLSFLTLKLKLVSLLVQHSALQQLMMLIGKLPGYLSAILSATLATISALSLHDAIYL